MSFESKPGVQGAALYQRIRNDLEARIMSGAWPPGHRVPFEHELMETYSCSRMTVNKVLSALADTGLVVRRGKREASCRDRGCNPPFCRFRI